MRLLLCALSLSICVLALAKVRRCGTADPTELQQQESAEVLNNWKASSRARSTATRAVKVYWHVITSGSTGDVSNTMIQNNIDILREKFGSTFTFDFDINNDVDRTDNSVWVTTIEDPGTAGVEAEYAMKSALRKGGCESLNIYSLRLPEALGWSYYPDECDDYFYSDGVVILDTTLPGGGSTDGYNLGYTLVHEVGHWLGLLHTFFNGCMAPGDSVDDTPYSKSASYGCEIGRDSCPNQPGNDPVTNYMDYSDDSCMTEFTSGQMTRMYSQYDAYRNFPFQSSPTKSPTSMPAKSPTMASTSPPTSKPTGCQAITNMATCANTPGCVTFVNKKNKTKCVDDTTGATCESLTEGKNCKRTEGCKWKINFNTGVKFCESSTECKGKKKKDCERLRQCHYNKKKNKCKNKKCEKLGTKDCQLKAKCMVQNGNCVKK